MKPRIQPESPTVLFVDDDLSFVHSFVDILRLSGFRVFTATDVREAMSAIDETGNALSAVILDMWLIDREANVSNPQGGLVVYEHLQKVAPKIPVVVFTAHLDNELIDSLGKRGGSPIFWRKGGGSPFRFIEMLTSLVGKDEEKAPRTRRVPLDGTDKTSAIEDIPAGEKGATQFQEFVFKALGRIFDRELCSGRKEHKILHGLKRIDISFRNRSKEGFFHDLSIKYQIKSPWVFVECKNYSSDLGNPEVDQVAGRLNEVRGQFAILAFRRCKDIDLLRNRCADALKEKKYILPMDEEMFSRLLTLRDQEDYSAIDSMMHEALSKIVFA